jgi:hypothetical protein
MSKFIGESVMCVYIINLDQSIMRDIKYTNEKMKKFLNFL